MPDVFWLIAAQRRLQVAFTPTVPPGQFGQEYRKLCGALSRTFPDATAVIVRDRVAGFRIRSDVHALLVEVVHQFSQLKVADAANPGGAQPGANEPAANRTIRIGKPDFDQPTRGTPTRTTTHIVKTGDGQLLGDELAAWESVRPIGLTHHSILMVLRPGAIAPDGKLESIIYEDAHHVLGGDSIISLEQACLNCVQWGLPTSASLELVIKTIYETLGSDFYCRSYFLDTVQGNVRRLWNWLGEKRIDCARIAEILGCTAQARQVCTHLQEKEDFGKVWKDLAEKVAVDQQQLQQVVNLETIREHLTRSVEDWRDSFELGGNPQTERLQIRRELVAMLANKRDFFIDPVDYLRSVLECPQYCPLLLWGCSHGDLHGRNVLISLADGSATLPALFDYEDMATDNLIGWDFVKLETETKVRAVHQLYRGELPDFVHQVRMLECYLAEKTHAMHDEREAKVEQFKLSKKERNLAELILAIRKSAREHMGRRRSRDRRWLEEYYFLLAYYGISAARFATYQPRHVMAALVSAGVAARLLTRPWYHLETQIRENQDKAKQLCDQGADPQTNKPVREPCEMSHHTRLAFATVWCRCGKPTFVEAGIEILKELRREYPHILEIDEELVLQNLELGLREEAETLLSNVSTRYNQLSEEMLCRFGRSWKNKGAELLKSASDRQEAYRHFEQALRWYQRAFSLRENYYPGVNVATLQFLLGQEMAARQTIAEVASAVQEVDSGVERTWAQASRAELELLLANLEKQKGPEHCKAARDLYESAVAELPLRDRLSMQRQVEMILEFSTEEVRDYWPEETIAQVFSTTLPPADASNPNPVGHEGAS